MENLFVPSASDHYKNAKNGLKSYVADMRRKYAKINFPTVFK